MSPNMKYICRAHVTRESCRPNLSKAYQNFPETFQCKVSFAKTAYISITGTAQNRVCAVPIVPICDILHHIAWLFLWLIPGWQRRHSP